MNQTFNIKRFGRYARFILSLNRWYYGVMLVFFAIPATVLSLCGLGPDGARSLVGGLIATATICLSILPNIELSKYGGLARQITIPASWLEKLIIEIISRFWVLVVPFCIHAIAYACGFNGISSATADGFSPATISSILIWATLFFFTISSFDNGKNGNTLSGKKMVSTNLLFAIAIGMQGFNYANMSRYWENKPEITYILLIISAVLFICSIILCRRRRIK